MHIDIIIPFYKKARYRLAKEFNISVPHLEQAYQILNGKKIDGIFATTLMDRWGFSDGYAVNRKMLAEKLGIDSIAVIDEAQRKLGDIVTHKDIKKAYFEALKEDKILADKALRDSAVYGEGE